MPPPVTLGSRTRLAVVVSHPIQYYAPWFRHLNASAEVDLKVFYLSNHGVIPRADTQFGATFAWDTDLLSGYNHEFIENRAKRPDVNRLTGLHNPKIRRALQAFSPHAILLYGYAFRTHLDLLLRPPAPILFRGDSHLIGEHAKSPRSLLRRLALHLIYTRPVAFLPVGSANTAYFRHHGVPPEKLFLTPHAVNQSHFTAHPDHIAAAAAQRAEMGIADKARVVLFAGKLIPKKRPDLLLAAFLHANTPDSHLILAGDGEMTPTLRATAAGHDNVHFLPFANQSGMPIRYLLGDIFCLPSQGRHETWGLAVNETMHLGRPAIVSDHVGCHPDLVIPHRTGWVFPAGDEAALSVLLRQLLTRSRNELAVLGATARDHAAAFSYEASTEGLLRSLASLGLLPLS